MNLIAEINVSFRGGIVREAKTVSVGDALRLWQGKLDCRVVGVNEN